MTTTQNDPRTQVYCRPNKMTVALTPQRRRNFTPLELETSPAARRNDGDASVCESRVGALSRLRLTNTSREIHVPLFRLLFVAILLAVPPAKAGTSNSPAPPDKCAKFRSCVSAARAIEGSCADYLAMKTPPKRMRSFGLINAKSFDITQRKHGGCVVPPKINTDGWLKLDDGRIQFYNCAGSAVLPAQHLVAVALLYVTSQQQLDQVRAGQSKPEQIQIALDPKQARTLADQMLKAASIIERNALVSEKRD